MLAVELDNDEEELLLLAEKVPDSIRRRVIVRSDAFRRLAGLSASLDWPPLSCQNQASTHNRSLI